MTIAKNIFLTFLLLPLVASAQTGTLPVAGLTPQSPFYFLDRLGEIIQELVAFSPEDKIRLQVTFTAERIAEIQLDMERKDLDPHGLDVAKKRLENHLATASGLIAEEKKKGHNVDEWEGMVEKESRVSKQVLEDSYELAKDLLEDEREALKDELEMAKKSGDESKTLELKAQINALEEEKDELENDREAQKRQLENERVESGDDEESEGGDLDDELKDIEDQLNNLDKRN